MIYCNFTNPPGETDISCAATVADIIAKFPGFPGYVYHNPDQPGSSGDGMGYPYDLNGPDWKAASKLAGNLIARIGGCATHDLPPRDGPIDTLAKRLRPSTLVIGDYASGSDAQAESQRYGRVFAANGMIFAHEANAKRSWVIPDANTWISAEWFSWDVPLPAAAASNWSVKRWKIAELLAIPGTKVIVEINSSTRHDVGFANGVADWPSQKVAMAKAYHSIDPARVIVSVRMSGMSAAQVAELRALN